MSAPPLVQSRPLSLLSIIIPALNEAGCIASTIEHLHVELRLQNIPHEIVVVDDGSSDDTWAVVSGFKSRIEQIVPVKNDGPHGFGRAVVCGFEHMKGDAAVVMMAD